MRVAERESLCFTAQTEELIALNFGVVMENKSLYLALNDTAVKVVLVIAFIVYICYKDISANLTEIELFYIYLFSC